ncbi:MAG: hypothetical protein ABH844_02990 [Candidatus Omnitrophota bacterium]
MKENRAVNPFDRLLEDAKKLELVYDEQAAKQLNLLRVNWDDDIAELLRARIDSRKYSSLVSREISPPPSREQVDGDIEQGICSNNLVYKIPLSLYVCGKLVLGSIGTGKTSDAYLDVLQLRKINTPVPVVIFDFRDDYSPLSNYLDGAFINATDLRLALVMALEGITKDNWRNFWTGITCDVLNLHEASLLLLRDSAMEVEARNPEYTIFDLMRYLEYKQRKSFGTMKNKFDTLNVKIRGFINGMGKILKCKASMSVDEIFNYGLVVINMVGLSIIEKKFIFYYLLGTKILKSIATRQRGGILRTIVLVDESEHYIGINTIRETGRLPQIVELINFCRDAGIGQIYIAHNVSKLIDEVKQLAIIKSFRASSLEDVNESANIMNVPWDKRGFFAGLKQRECLISTAMYPFPVSLTSLDFVINNKVDKNNIELSRQKFLEKVKYAPLEKTAAIESTEPNTNSSEKNTVALTPDTDTLTLPDLLSAEQIALLMDVRKNSGKKVKERYKDLGLSIGKGTRIKSKLINDGFLKETEINNYKRGGIFRILNLTKKSYDCLKIPAPKNGRGGPEHQYWVERINDIYSVHYNVGIEYCISPEGKCIDVYAWNDVERIGIEIALSPSPAHEADNVEKCLAFNCTKVVVVCKDEETMEKIRRLATQKFKESDLGKVEFRLVRELDNYSVQDKKAI